MGGTDRMAAKPVTMRKLRPAEWLLIFVVSSALTAAFGFLIYTPRAYEAELGPAVDLATLAPQQVLPAFSLKTIDGATVSSQDFAGHVAIIHFWGTRCPPCVAETPAMVKEYKARLARIPDLRFLAVATDTDPNAVSRFVAAYGIPWKVADSLMIPNAQLGIDLKVEWTPTTIVVDKAGRIRWIGSKFPSNMEKIVRALAAEPLPASGV